MKHILESIVCLINQPFLHTQAKKIKSNFEKKTKIIILFKPIKYLEDTVNSEHYSLRWRNVTSRHVKP